MPRLRKTAARNAEAADNENKLYAPHFEALSPYA